MDTSQSSYTRVSDIKSWASVLHSSHRPLLLHLNADTTWLIQLPYPASAKVPPGRTHFNILLDPWLQGPQSDVAWWFSSQWHVVPSAVATINDLNKTLQEVETRGISVDCSVEGNPSDGRQQRSYVDAVAISHEFTDHCHRATLEELPSDTPIYAADLAAELIRGWGHFERVITLPALGASVDWSKLTVGPLPDWIALGRVTTPGNSLYYHAAILVAFDINYRPRSRPATPELLESSTSDTSSEASDSTGTDIPPGEVIIYSPHGINSRELMPIPSSNLKTLAILHGMHDIRIWLTAQLNLGALNAIQAVATTGARYWVGTHDEEKTGRGLVAPFLLRKRYSFQDAVEDEYAKLKSEGRAPKYEFRELASGDGWLLE